jgi:integrase
LAKLEYDLAPLRERYGSLAVQDLAKYHLDSLVADLVAGGTETAKGRKRRPWSPTAVNKVITSARQMLADAQAQGLIVRNVASLVRLVTVPHQEVDTYTDVEVNQILASLSCDRLAHAWELALAGLRRGEIAGLRWDDVDFEANTLAIVQGRVHARDRVIEGDPKSAASRRVLPLPARLVTVLKAAKARQAAERLQLGPAFRSGDYVVSNEIGDPYHPQTLSRYWAKAMKRAGVRHIKLHGGRHTCATLMHFDGVKPVVVADWIGHDDANLTIKLYTHSQPDALRAAGETLNRVVTFCDTEAQ